MMKASYSIYLLFILQVSSFSFYTALCFHVIFGLEVHTVHGWIDRILNPHDFNINFVIIYCYKCYCIGGILIDTVCILL